MEHSDDEGRDRSRSRSPLARRGGTDDGDDMENLTPQSRKIANIVNKIVKAQLEPVKKNLNKIMDTSSQIKSVTEQTKRGVTDVRKSNAQIEDHLKKASRADPKSSLSPTVIGKLNDSVFRNLKKGNPKEETQTAVTEELLDRAFISPTDEESVKSVVATEYKHLKSHLRGLISQDLSLGNYGEMPKTTKYIGSHLKVQAVDNSSKEFFTIMGLGLVKFENVKAVPLSESDKGNLARINESLDNYWAWVNMKFQKFQRGEPEESLNRKLKGLMDNYGYEPKKTDRAVRRNP